MSFSIRLMIVLCVLLLGTVNEVVAQQSVMVGTTEVTWTGDWQYDPASSVDEQATLTQIDVASGSLKLATYGEFADATVENPQEALDAFIASFFQGAGATNVIEAGSGSLESGGVWELHAFDLEGLSLTLAITVEIGATGDYSVSTLTANTETFDDSLAAAQRDIMLNGESTFLDGLDNQRMDADAGSASQAGQIRLPSVTSPSQSSRPSAPEPQVPSNGSLQILSVTTKDAGIGDGSIYAYVEVANGSGELYSYVGLEGTCRDSGGGILGTGWGNTMNVAPGETVVITMIFLQVPGCTDVDVRFDSLTGMF